MNRLFAFAFAGIGCVIAIFIIISIASPAWLAVSGFGLTITFGIWQGKNN